MEGLSGFDRSMMKRLESSALAFYGLKHQQMQYEEAQCRARGICSEDMKTNRTMKYQRPVSDTSSSSSSSSPASPVYTRHFSSDVAPMSETVKKERLTDTEDCVLPVTKTPTRVDCSPRTTADGQGDTMSSSCISFSISRILGHNDNTSLMDPRGPSQSAGHSVPPVHIVERTRSQSGMTSPDSSCRVAGEDFDQDMKKLTDSDDSDDDDDDDVVVNDDDVNVVKLQTVAQSPASAAAAVCGDTLHGLSWLQCTRYKPPKLPRSKKLKDGTKKRKLGRNPRVPFTQHQVSLLEQKFRRTHYLSSIDVAELSSALNLTENRVKIWFQNRRARERRGKDSVSSAAQPLSVASGGGGGGVVSDAEDHHHRHIKGLLGTPHGDDDADGCCRTISPFNLDEVGGRGILTTDGLLRRQPFLSPDSVESRRYAVPPSTSSVAAMMRATFDYCRPPSWTVGLPRHHLTPPSLPVSAAADLLAQLTARQPLSTAFSLPPVNLLRF